MLQGLCKPSWAMVVVLVLLVSPAPVEGQRSASDGSGSDTADEQTQAIDRVDELAGRLQAMPWGPEVVYGLARLGTTACQYDQELGIRVFDKAYSVVAGLAFESSGEISFQALSGLASAALRCHPTFRDRPLTRDGFSSELSATAHLDAALASVATDPHYAAELAQGTASRIDSLDQYDQLDFLSVLWDLRQHLPTVADGLFRDALLRAATAGKPSDLFTLGNYVFQARFARDHGVTWLPMPEDGSAYKFSELRPGLPADLAKHYARITTDRLLTGETEASNEFESFALATQLASWSSVNDSERMPLLDSLLRDQANLIGDSSLTSEIQARLEPMAEDYFEKKQQELESRSSEISTSQTGFELFDVHTRREEFDRAETVVEHLPDELRQPATGLLEYKRLIRAISENDLTHGEAGVASLEHGLYQFLAALSLAHAYYLRSKEAEHGLEEDLDVASRLLRLAIAGTDGVPDQLRSQGRILVASVSARIRHVEDALLVLELAVQPTHAEQEHVDQERVDQMHGQSPKTATRVRFFEGRGFVAEFTDGQQVRSFDLTPPNLRSFGFEEAIVTLSVLPDMDLDRLDSIVSRSADLKMRIDGLVAVASGGLAKAFTSDTR